MIRSIKDIAIVLIGLWVLMFATASVAYSVIWVVLKLGGKL